MSNTEKAVVDQAAAAVKEFKPEPITFDRMKDAESERMIKTVNCDTGTKPEHLMDPAYWAHVASTLRPWTRIEARADDETWMAELLVLSCGRLYARTKLLHLHDLTEGTSAGVDENADEPYYAKWCGPHLKWAVIRRSDSGKITDSIDSKDQAVILAQQECRRGSK